MPAALAPGFLFEYRCDIDLDPHTQIFAALADQTSEVPKCELSVLTCIASNDVTAPPPDQLVNAEVFEVTAVREIDILAPRVRPAKQLFEQVEARSGPWFAPLLACGVAQPPTEPGVENGHEEGHSRR
jgi:hypothetical protein